MILRVLFNGWSQWKGDVVGSHTWYWSEWTERKGIRHTKYETLPTYFTMKGKPLTEKVS